MSPKNLDRVENPSPEEKIPLSCRSEEECEYLQRERVGRSNEDSGLHKRQVDCDVLPERDDRISCRLFMGKREELEGNYARRGGFVNPLLRTIPNQPKCTKVWCRYNPGKKKFMVKKAVRATGRQSNAGDVSSDTSKKPCDDFQDLLCGSSSGGIGRKRSVS